MTDPWATFRRSRRAQAAGLILGWLGWVALLVRVGSAGAVIAGVVGLSVGGAVVVAAIAWGRSRLRRFAPNRIYGCSAMLLDEGNPEKPVDGLFWVEQTSLEWVSLLKRNASVRPLSSPLSQIVTVNTTHLGWLRRLGIEVVRRDGQRSHFVASAKQGTVERTLAAVGVRGEHHGPGNA